MEPAALAGTRLVGMAKKIGIFLLRIGMQGDRQHIVALVKDLLRAVAMVIVDIEDGDAPGAGVAERLGGNGRVVEEAIAAVEIGAGVMAGRPAERDDSAP